MVQDFFKYEKKLGIECLIPFLENQKIDLKNKSVLDLGCGYGGLLVALEEKYNLGSGTGIDLDPEMIAEAQINSSQKLILKNQNFFQIEKETFDFILMRDVLEHIVEVENALQKARELLIGGGMIYVSFAPFYSPFGGHQHNGSGFFSNLPWLQFLPDKHFRRLLNLKGNSYKTLRGLEADMDSVLKTRLTISRFLKILERSGFKVQYHAQYLVRPDYKIKFGLPLIRFPNIPILDDLLCTGYEALLIKVNQRK